MTPRLTLQLSLCLLSGPALAQGELLVGNKRADTVWRLSLEDGRRLAEIASGAGPHEIAVSADGRRAVVTDYGHHAPGHSLTVLDLADGTAPRSIALGAHGRPHGLRLRGAAEALVTTEQSHALLRVDVARGEVLQAIEVGAGLGHMVALGVDGRTAYVSKIEAGTVSRIDLVEGRKTHEVAAGRGAEGIEVAPDGSVWVTNRDEDTVTVHDPDTLARRATLASKGFPIRVAFTPDGRHALVTNARAGSLSVFDAADHRLVAAVPLRPDGADEGQSLLGSGAMPIGVIADPARPRVYVAISGADRIAVIDRDTWQVVAYWPTGREPDALGLVP